MTEHKEKPRSTRLSIRAGAELSRTERMERFVALQKRASALLAASPEGWRRYWQRNLRKRRAHAS